MTAIKSCGLSTLESSPLPLGPLRSRPKCRKFRVEPLSLDHLDYLDPEGHQLVGHKALLAKKRSGDDLSELTRRGFTGFFHGSPCVCAGLIEMWPKRGVAWSVIDRKVSGSMMIPIHRAVLWVIDSYQPDVFNRLEMSVVQDFDPGHKWASMLGFVEEGIMRHYDQWGRDYTLYARVRL